MLLSSLSKAAHKTYAPIYLYVNIIISHEDWLMIPNKGKANSSGKKTENLTKAIEWSGTFSLLGKSTLLLIWISSAVSYRFRIHLKQSRTYCLLILYILFSLSLDLINFLDKNHCYFFLFNSKKERSKKVCCFGKNK